MSASPYTASGNAVMLNGKVVALCASEETARELASVRDLRAACDAAESILRYMPDTSTNCSGTKPNMTTRKALAMVRAALGNAGVDA